VPVRGYLRRSLPGCGMFAQVLSRAACSHVFVSVIRNPAEAQRKNTSQQPQHHRADER
jgi:hypothetical protein